eukprot:GEMP01029319.1.p1 GENE.GEMP01029319.1~~GEMP01029319.1.p1  ORF type:complete len:295 (+),score=48.67 GEMP01029319.1:111-995(+)
MGQDMSCVNCMNATCPRSIFADEIVEPTSHQRPSRGYEDESRREDRTPVKNALYSPRGFPEQISAAPHTNEHIRDEVAPAVSWVPPSEHKYFAPHPDFYDQAYAADDESDTSQQLRAHEIKSEGHRPSPPFSLEDVLTNLNACEEVFYYDVFAGFDDYMSGKVSEDHILLRETLMHHSSLSEDVVDYSIAQVSQNGQVDRDGFLKLIRTHASDDTAALVTFCNVSDDRPLTNQETRTALIMFANDYLIATFSEKQWDRIMTTVLSGMDKPCEEKDWHQYCNLLLRIVRMLQCQD